MFITSVRVFTALVLLTIFGLFIGVAKAEAPIGELREPPTLEQKFAMVFGDKHKTMLDIANKESSLNPKAVGYNCHYYREDGKRYSTHCKKEDRDKAWSWDCGVLQNNTSSKEECEKLKDVDYNLQVAKGKLDTQGLCAWVVVGC